MSHPRQAVLILQGRSAYNNFDTFYAMVARSLLRLGLDPIMLDMKDFSVFNSTMAETLRTYTPARVLGAFMLNGFGLELGDASPEGNLWTRLQIPALSWMGDHPCYYMSRHQHKSPAITLMYEYGDYHAFHRDHVRSAGRTAYAPFGVWDLGRTPQPREPKAGHKPLIIMPKTGHDPDELETAWGNLPKLLRTVINGAIEHYWGETRRSGNVESSVFTAADAVRLELRNDLKLFSFIFVQVDDYIRRRKAKVMMEQLLPLPVQIIGAGLDYMDTSGARATFLPPMDYAQVVDLYYQADAIINMNPNIDDECHDRVYSAFGCGALPISDINPWWEKNCPDLMPYSFDFRDRSLTAAVEKVLDDPVASADLAWRQRGVAMARRTFDDAVADAVDLAMMQRYFEFNFAPPQAYFAKGNG